MQRGQISGGVAEGEVFSAVVVEVGPPSTHSPPVVKARTAPVAHCPLNLSSFCLGLRGSDLVLQLLPPGCLRFRSGREFGSLVTSFMGSMRC